MLDSRFMVLNQCNFIVLDEADVMIEKGFEPQIVQVLEAMPKDTRPEEEAPPPPQPTGPISPLDALLAQSGPPPPKDFRSKYRTTFMFSATMPAEVERLSRFYLRRPAHVQIGTVGRAVDRIKQIVHFTHSDNE